MKILHFSDVHVDVPPAAIPMRDWIGKRVLGGANHLFRRRRHHARAREKLAALARFADAASVDAAICTGDYTILGTDPEIEAARSAVDALTKRPLGFVTMPGNHDVYLPDSVRERRFERRFGEFLRTDLPELAGPDGWPQVRLLGAHVAVVAVRSARPNPAPWASSGRVDQDELAALRRAVADPRVRDRFVVVATHYAMRRADGTHDRAFHGLVNADDVLDAIRSLPRGCLVHGHLHRRFRLALPGVRPAILGAGSATHEGEEGFWLIEVDRDLATATPGYFDGEDYRIDASAAAPM
jgi:3',5'-cyclic AMP phosphodiesterase CpdA